MAYTSPRARLILATLGLSLILATAAIAQVKIIVPAQQYKMHDEIHAKAENSGNNAVTFSVEFGQTSMKGGDVRVHHHPSGWSGITMVNGALSCLAPM